MVGMRLHLLGGFSADAADGRALGPLPRKARGLLAFLALADPPAQSRHRLAGLFWPEHAEDAARTSLRQTLSAIRRQMGGLIVADQESVAIAAGAVTVDSREFERLLDEGAPDALQRAFDLYRGNLLEGFRSDTAAFDHWVAAERERLHRRAIDAGMRLLDEREALGQVDAALPVAARIVALDPLQEAAHRALMRLHARRGHPAAALRQFHALRHSLRLELGVVPDAATEALFRQIVRDRRTPDGAGTTDAAPTTIVLADASAGAPVAGGNLPVGAEDEATQAVERRQVTVLCCEIAAFDVLATHLDPEALWALVQAYRTICRAAVERFDGTLQRHRGESITACFGLPVAHEDDSVRAIHAARAIVENVHGMSGSVEGGIAVRIGVASGIVVASAADRGAIGTAIHVADRLQARAQPDTILVDDTARRLAAGAFRYRDAGRIDGADGPPEVFEVRGTTRAPTRFEAAAPRRLTPLVGREQELGLLLDRWALGREGDGQVVLLSGEPGIGKSRVLRTLHERLSVRGARVLRFQCSPFHVHSALRPTIDHLERLLHFAPTDTADARLDRLEALLVGEHGRPPADLRLIAAMLSLPCANRYGELTMAPQKQREDTLRALVDLVEATARLRPGVLLFEDLHWADPTTIELLDLLVERVRSMPLLAVLTYRPEFTPRWAHHDHVSHLDLAKLSRAQCRAMIAGVSDGKALPEDLVERILGKTDGVPLFVEELTKTLLESDRLRTVADRYEYVGDANELSIPATLRDSLVARLDRVASVKEVAQTGAVIGRDFRYALLAAVVSMPPDALDAALRLLTDAGLAFRHGAPPDATYRFKHALLRDAAYDSLLRARRQELHARIAQAIEDLIPGCRVSEPELLAHHLSAAGLDAAAIPLWHRAATNAMTRVALIDALAHCARGLARIDTVADPQVRARQELALQLVRGQAASLSRGWATAEPEQAFSRARALCEIVDDAPEVFPAMWGVWAYLDVAGRMREAQGVAAEFLERALRVGDAAAACEGHRIVGEMAYRLGDPATARFHLEAGIRLCETGASDGSAGRYGQDSLLTNLVYLAWALWLLGYPEQARQAQARAIDHANAAGQPFDRAWAHVFDAFLQGNLRDWPATAEAARRTIAVCSEHGFGFWRSFGACYLHLAQLHLAADAAEANLSEEHAASLRAFGARVSQTSIHALVADGLAELGQADAARAFVDAGLAMVGMTDEYFAESDLHRIDGDLHSMRGPSGHDEAADCFRRALDVARRQQSKTFELRAATGMARLELARGRPAAAKAVLAPVYSWFTEGHDTADLVDARRLLSDLA